MDRYVLGDTDGSRVGGTQRAHMTHVSLTPRTRRDNRHGHRLLPAHS
jgi:hypothetical protein